MAAETLVVISKVKEYLKAKGFATSDTAVDALSDEIRRLLDSAAKRAEANGRSTIKDRDI